MHATERLTNLTPGALFNAGHNPDQPDGSRRDDGQSTYLLRIQFRSRGQRSYYQDAGCGAVPVVDAGRPVGILTDRDVALAVANNPDLGSLPVADLMSKEVISVLPDASLEEVGAMFGQHSVHRVLVVDAAGQLQGIVALSDLAPHVSEESLGRCVNEVMEGS